MANYIKKNEAGEITEHATWCFPGSVQVDYEVVFGIDGKLYKSGTEPKVPEPTIEEIYESLRIATEQRLTATDQYGMDDYPDNEKRAAFRAYRKDLRELNHQEGSPWDGGGELTPWPKLPTIE